MALSNYDRSNFADSIFGSMLDDCIDWISSNISCNEVYDEDDLICEVSSSFQPDEVFSAEELDEWAKDNGYSLDEE